MGDCKFLRQKKQVKINGEWVDTRSYRYLPYCVDITPSVIVKGGNPNGKVYVGFGKKDVASYGYTKTISLDASGNGRINLESDAVINDVTINDNPSSCIVEIFGCYISSLCWGNSAEEYKHADKISISCSRYVRINELFNSMGFLGKTIKFNGFDTSKVTDTSEMFWKCHNLTSLDLSGWNVSNVTKMSSMFWECSSLISLKVPNFDDLLEINMDSMFYGCSSLASLDLSGWRTAKIVNMENMFARCTNLTSLDLSGWDISHVRIYGMFAGCSSLTTIYMRNCDGFDVAYIQEELKRDKIPLDQVTIITE